MNCLFCFFVSCLGGSPSATDILPSPREVRAGGKTFFFDVERNDRGVFVRLSEVSSTGGIACTWSISRKMLLAFVLVRNFLVEVIVQFCPGS